MRERLLTPDRIKDCMGIYLDLSTVHLSPTTRDRFLSDSQMENWNSRAPHFFVDSRNDDCGWWVFVQNEWEAEDKEVHPELILIFKLAKRKGCTWIKFDCEGPVHPNLEQFDD